MFSDFASTGNRAFANFEEFRASANWQTLAVLIIAEFKRRQLGGHHGALRFIEMATAEIERNDVSHGIVALIHRKCRLRASFDTGAITIAAVKNFTLEHDDRFAQPMCLDVNDELVEVLAIEQREQGWECMKFQSH